jgi:hypothetical protein
MTEDSSEQESEENESEDSLLSETNEKRLKISLVLTGGFISAFISSYTFGFSDLSALYPVGLLGSAVLLIFWGLFEKPEPKTILFAYLITLTTWFLTGTFILNL